MLKTNQKELETLVYVSQSINITVEIGSGLLCIGKQEEKTS